METSQKPRRRKKVPDRYRSRRAYEEEHEYDIGTNDHDRDY